MREKTYLLAIAGLDFLLILAGGVMAWQRALPRLPGPNGHTRTGADPVLAIISTILIAGIGAWLMYEMNGFAFALAESRSADRNAVLSASLFAGATVAGALMAITMG